MTIPMHEFTVIQNPAHFRILDSGFWMDTQTQSNQAFDADSRIRRILTWILRILKNPNVHAGFKTVPESKSSPHTKVCVEIPRLRCYPRTGSWVGGSGGGQA